MTEDRLAAIEARLGRLEDERDIARLIAAYGPLVDSGCAEEVADLWTSKGVYDVDTGCLEGHDQITEMVRSEAHQGLIHNGCAHLLGPPHVTLDGDEAIAVCHSLLLVRVESRYIVRRATANHWLLRRGRTGWKVQKRTSRLLDGGPEARAVLASAGDLSRSADPAE